jgi:hypothetical protein
MEENVSEIYEFIKVFHTKIEYFQSHTLPRTLSKEKEQREKTTIISFANIESLDLECTRMCDESTYIWTHLTMNLEMKEIEDKVRSVQEKARQANESIKSLPAVK